MNHYKYIILGAGPSGLGFAHTLKNMGETSFLVIEKEAVVGGLCRSEMVDGAPLDIGGGHFLDLKREAVLDFLFRFMPRSEWREYKRVSKINIRGTAVDYPLESNLWQLPVDDQVAFLESIAQAGCIRGLPAPESFEEWISWKLGNCIAEEYMLPYNRKIWSVDLNELGTYWLYKLPDVSFRETLQSCLERKPSGSLPAHGTFLYPKHFGYGEIWKRMGEALGNHLLTSTPVSRIDITGKIINDTFKADKIINTIPWTAWLPMSDLPESIKEQILKLHFVSIDIDYHAETPATGAHWIYDPDENLAYHRILCRSNFCDGAKGHWTEANSRRVVRNGVWKHRNEYAYPLNTRDKPQVIAEISRWAAQNDIIGIGRWGTWEHMNSDVAVSMGIEAAQKMVGAAPEN
jgi:protoporphyrinogen oxidase